MIEFRNDYSEGAHESILQVLCDINRQQHRGYGEDTYCRQSEEILQKMCGQPQAKLHFIPGGTLANLTVIASILRPYQGVIAADTGHINAHETGAIEATGHKVLSLPNKSGKITASDIQMLSRQHWEDETHEHMVQPGMVYISNTTELGSIYSLDELKNISNVCRELQLPLFLDGARLGYALASRGCDLDLQDIAQYCDVFTMGMTKQGALFGEAVVILNPDLQTDFRYSIKQRGGMLAKGWLMGLQFEALMQDDLYFDLSKHAVSLAMQLREGLEKLGVSFFADSPSNQQFPILPNKVINKLRDSFGFQIIQKADENSSIIRFCTSWATREEDVRALLEAVARAIA
ncbi:MAG: low specificity L-threonine aldolase [Clostridiales bacterium]|nr:low specificity L-threonine aldolase [Clostridiales bacterium]